MLDAVDVQTKAFMSLLSEQRQEALWLAFIAPIPTFLEQAIKGIPIIKKLNLRVLASKTIPLLTSQASSGQANHRRN